MRQLPDIRTLVIKIGSNILSDPERGIDTGVISRLASTVHTLKQTVPNIVIVSSGAVAAGFRMLGFDKRPTDIIDKQAAAAVGQARLVWLYEEALEPMGHHVAQMLITKDDFANRRRYLNARYAIRRLLDLGVVPIINENDSVVVDELKYIETFGDNDNLSALVAGLIGADLLLILSDVDGLFDKNPAVDPTARLINEVKFVDEELMNVAGESVSGVGTGGMKSKLAATKKALDAGCYVGIINGKEPENAGRFIDGELVGTFFSHIDDAASRRKLWIAHAAIARGDIIVDDGATRALGQLHKSLLPSGVVDVIGKFGIGDIVRVLDLEGREVARGKTRYAATDVRKIMGKKTDAIFDVLGYKFSDEIIHRDDLVLSNTGSGDTE